MPSLSPKNLPSADLSPAQLERGVSPWLDAWRRLRRNHLAVFGGITLIVLSLLCVIGPWFSSYGYEETDLYNTFSPPSAKHWLGTDQLGRDLLTRLMFGGRISLMVGLIATFVALTIGVIYGAVSGYIGGKLDRVMMRIVDILYALPFTIFVILLTVMLETPAQILDEWIKHLSFGDWQPFINTRGASRILLLFAAIGAVEWLTMARIVRSQIMSLKRMEFIEAARSLGFGTPRIIFRHMIPNILGPIIVYTTLTIPGVMLLEAFLSFLGLGVQPPMSSWGVLIKDGAERMEEYPWLLMFPGTVFSLTLFSLNFLGDGLRDALDVRSAKD
ncbi:MAG: ABC transporter permease [Verrucomicrobiota bacterium]